MSETPNDALENRVFQTNLGKVYFKEEGLWIQGKTISFLDVSMPEEVNIEGSNALQFKIEILTTKERFFFFIEKDREIFRKMLRRTKDGVRKKMSEQLKNKSGKVVFFKRSRSLKDEEDISSKLGEITEITFSQKLSDSPIFPWPSPKKDGEVRPRRQSSGPRGPEKNPSINLLRKKILEDSNPPSSRHSVETPTLPSMEIRRKSVKIFSRRRRATIGDSLFLQAKDLEYFLKKVSVNGLDLQFASASLRNHRALVLAAVNNNGLSLDFASRSLRQDRVVVQQAVMKNAFSLQYADIKLRSNKRYVLKLARTASIRLRHIDETLHNDREVVLSVLSRSGNELKFCSKSLRGDKKIVLRAVKKSGRSLEYASEEMRKDLDVITTALYNDVSSFHFALNWSPEIVKIGLDKYSEEFIKSSNELMKKEKKFCLSVVSENGYCLRFLPEQFLNDYEIVRAATNQNSIAFKFASENMKRNRDLIFELSKKMPWVLEYVKDLELKSDKEFLKLLVGRNGLCIRYVSEEMQNDREFVSLAVKSNAKCLQYLNEEFRNDRGFRWMRGLQLFTKGQYREALDDFLFYEKHKQFSELNSTTKDDKSQSPVRKKRTSAKIRSKSNINLLRRPFSSGDLRKRRKSPSKKNKFKQQKQQRISTDLDEWRDAENSLNYISDEIFFSVFEKFMDMSFETNDLEGMKFTLEKALDIEPTMKKNSMINILQSFVIGSMKSCIVVNKRLKMGVLLLKHFRRNYFYSDLILPELEFDLLELFLTMKESEETTEYYQQISNKIATFFDRTPEFFSFPLKEKELDSLLYEFVGDVLGIPAKHFESKNCPYSAYRNSFGIHPIDVFYGGNGATKIYRLSEIFPNPFQKYEKNKSQKKEKMKVESPKSPTGKKNVMTSIFFYCGEFNVKTRMPHGVGVILFPIMKPRKRGILSIKKSPKSLYARAFQGSFKNGVKDGRGREFDLKCGCVIFDGSYKNDCREGWGKVYKPSGSSQLFSYSSYYKSSSRSSSQGRVSSGSPSSLPNQPQAFLSFEGTFGKGGLREGPGMEFEEVPIEESSSSKTSLNNDPTAISTYVAYEGNYHNGVRDGRGESYNGKEFVQGIWKDGKISERIQEYPCKLIQFSKIKKHLTAEKLIGRGGFGMVYRVPSTDLFFVDGSTCLTGLSQQPTEVAIKIIILDRLHDLLLLSPRVKKSLELISGFTSSEKHVDLVTKNSKPHFPRIYGMFSGRILEHNNSKWYVGYAMELGKESIHQIIQTSESTLPFDEKFEILLQTAKGMNILHHSNIMHRDLKWENVLLNAQNRIMIIDFDTSLKEDQNKWKVHHQTYSNEGIGTDGFAAPEISTGVYDTKVDVFSFGVMIYALLYEKAYPYFSQYQCVKCGTKVEDMDISTKHPKVHMHVRDCNFRPLIDPEKVRMLPERYRFFIDLMCVCWENCAMDRPSFERIVEILEAEKRKERSFTIIRVQQVKRDEDEVEMIGVVKKVLLMKMKILSLKNVLLSKFPLGTEIVELVCDGKRLELDIDVELMISKTREQPMVFVELSMENNKEMVDGSIIGSSWNTSSRKSWDSTGLVKENERLRFLVKKREEEMEELKEKIKKKKKMKVEEEDEEESEGEEEEEGERKRKMRPVLSPGYEEEENFNFDPQILKSLLKEKEEEVTELNMLVKRYIIKVKVLKKYARSLELQLSEKGSRDNSPIE